MQCPQIGLIYMFAATSSGQINRETRKRRECFRSKTHVRPTARRQTMLCRERVTCNTFWSEETKTAQVLERFQHSGVDVLWQGLKDQHCGVTVPVVQVGPTLMGETDGEAVMRAMLFANCGWSRYKCKFKKNFLALSNGAAACSRLHEGNGL